MTFAGARTPPVEMEAVLHGPDAYANDIRRSTVITGRVLDIRLKRPVKVTRNSQPEAARRHRLSGHAGLFGAAGRNPLSPSCQFPGFLYSLDFLNY